MVTSSFKLLTYPYNKSIAFGPRVCIALNSYGTKTWPKGNKEEKFETISIVCINVADLEHEINRLIRELEKIKRQGQQFFKRELEKRTQKPDFEK